jgi:hypothetical protein
MRWQADLSPLMLSLLWACLIVAVAGFGAVIVRNVTDVLQGIVQQPASVVIVEQPSR